MAKSLNCDLSIVIPVYNDEKRIISCLNTIEKFFKEKSKNVEVIVVCDGSKDKTPKNAGRKLGKFSPQFSTELMVCRENRGKGYAVKKGMLNAKGEYELFVDVDLAVPLSMIEECDQYFSRGDPIIIGSRRKADSIIKKKQPLYRRPLGFIFTNLVNRTLGLNLSDYTCGFKIFRSDVAQEIFSYLTINGFAFDAEALFLANKFGYTVKEIPVRWRHDSRNELSPIKTPLRMLKDIGLILVNNYKGDYSN